MVVLDGYGTALAGQDYIVWNTRSTEIIGKNLIRAPDWLGSWIGCRGCGDIGCSGCGDICHPGLYSDGIGAE